MSWFSSALSVPIDDKVAEATSEMIPNGEIDLTVALEISDLIRSKQTLPKDAMRSLKKRFTATYNPNVQKSCLKLIDFCIKNGGEHFVVEMSSIEFLEPLLAQIRGNSMNDEVKTLALELIQNWSLLFSKNPKLNYITVIYNKLSLEGIKFPSIYGAEFNDSFLDAKVAPEWIDSDACMICSDLFTVLNRKHHCRACGGVYCGKHSSNRLPLPEFGITIPVRVCDNCYQERKAKTKPHKEHHHRSKSKSKPKPVEEEDDDLRRAIEMSLKESGMAPPPAPSSGPSSRPQPIEDYSGEEDEDMKRAIEASLRDLKVSSPQQPSLEENPYSNIMPKFDSPQLQTAPVSQQPYQSSEQTSRQPSISNGRITMSDEDNLTLFANLLERYKNSNDNSIYQDEQIQTLHENLNSIRPKLNREIHETNSKYDQFTEMYSKIDTIMRLYDGILQAHMTSIYDKRQQQQQQQPQYQYQYQGQPQQGQYPQSQPQQGQYPQYPPTQAPQYPPYHQSPMNQNLQQAEYPPSMSSPTSQGPRLYQPSQPAEYQQSMQSPTSQRSNLYQQSQPQDYSSSLQSTNSVRMPPSQTTPALSPIATRQDLPNYPPTQSDISNSPTQTAASSTPAYPPSQQVNTAPSYPPSQPEQTTNYPPMASPETPKVEVPSYPPADPQQTSPVAARASIPSYPPAAPQQEESKYDFPGLPSYPAFVTELPVVKEEKKEEAPLIEL